MVKSIRVVNFRNYRDRRADFQGGLNIIKGRNGRGKTNLLEAIFFLLHGRSMRTGDAREMIRRGEEEALVEGIFGKDFETRIRRIIGEDGVIGGRTKEGELRAVSLQMEDLWMIKGRPETRRKYLDGGITRTRKGYAATTREYQRILKQRNEAIKMVRKRQKSKEYMRSWEGLLCEKGVEIVKERRAAVSRIEEEMEKTAERWGKEKVGIKYYSTMGEDQSDKEKVLARIRKMEEAEIRRGITLTGPHRDEMVFSMGGRNARRECSQGEQKMIVIMWKLAEARSLIEEAGKEVVLLMDDCLAELDEENRSIVIREMEDWEQAILTTTEDRREFGGYGVIRLD